VEFLGISVVSGVGGGSSGAAFDNAGTLILTNTEVIRNPFFSSGEYLIRNQPGSELQIKGNSSIKYD
jgi:hypothetical protein